MATSSLFTKLQEVRKSKSRKVNAYLAACVLVDYRAAALWKRLRSLAKMKARYEATLVGRATKRERLTGGQQAEADRLLTAAGLEPAHTLFTWDLTLPGKTYFGGDGRV